MKIYHGTRSVAGNAVVVTRGEAEYALAPRLDLRNHSLNGFEWGYSGSGPAQLALALTADALGDDARAERVYQQFKFSVVGTITNDVWTLTDAEVLAAVVAIERAVARVARRPGAGRDRSV